IFSVRHNAGIDCLLVEVLQVCKFTLRAYQVGSTEFLAGNRSQFSSDYMILRTVVPRNGHILDSRLRTFDDANLVIDCIVVNRSLYKIKADEEISIIHVAPADVAAFLSEFLTEALVKQIKIVNITLANTEYGVEQRIGELRISFPRDVAE